VQQLNKLAAPNQLPTPHIAILQSIGGAGSTVFTFLFLGERGRNDVEKLVGWVAFGQKGAFKNAFLVALPTTAPAICLTVIWN